jgi:hypothetical protein
MAAPTRAGAVADFHRDAVRQRTYDRDLLD